MTDDGAVHLPERDEDAKRAHEGCLDDESSNCFVYTSKKDTASGDGTVDKDSAQSPFNLHKAKMVANAAKRSSKGQFCKMSLACHKGGEPYATKGGFTPSCHANILNFGTVLSFVRKIAEVTAAVVAQDKWGKLEDRQQLPDGKEMMKQAATESYNSRHIMENHYDDKVSQFTEIECV